MNIVVRAMRESDLGEADTVFRLAFGTFLGLQNPAEFAGDADYVRSRFAAFPDRAFVAERGGEVLGSIFAARWGSFAFLGPLTTRPDCWDQGVAKRLLEPVLERFASWRVTLAGLYTFAHSPKHLGLYQKFGFWPRSLTALMARPVQARAPATQFARYSAQGDERGLEECAALTDRIYAGLDVADEIRAVRRFGLGDTVLVRESGALGAFAVCHCGAGSEGGSGTCYVKFAAVRPGPGAAERFRNLVGAIDALAREEGLSTVLAGVNAAREPAWRALGDAGFRPVMQGVAMLRNNDEGFNRPDVYALDDWR